MTDLSALEARLGYTFKDKTLLDRALTHSSLSGGAKTKIRDLERLEFLGDRVLGLLTAEELWRRFPDYEEGMLAPRFNALVRKETCVKAAVHFSIDQFVKMSDFFLKIHYFPSLSKFFKYLSLKCSTSLDVLYPIPNMAGIENSFFPSSHFLVM